MVQIDSSVHIDFKPEKLILKCAASAKACLRLALPQSLYVKMKPCVQCSNHIVDYNVKHKCAYLLKIWQYTCAKIHVLKSDFI